MTQNLHLQVNDESHRLLITQMSSNAPTYMVGTSSVITSALLYEIEKAIRNYEK